MVDDEEAAFFASGSIAGPVRPFALDKLWVRFHKRGFFFKLLEVLRGEADVGRKWRKDLRNAAVLAGQSQASIDLPQAFLWNMIVIELLLTRKSGGEGRYTDTLPERAEALLGWAVNWESDNYEGRIKRAWERRCDIIHEGKRHTVTLRDLFFTDTLVLNLFNNIINHIELFRSKKAVIEFSEKVKAERLLEIEPSVRPKTLELINPRYTKRD